MLFLSLEFYAVITVLLFLYYIMPVNIRWSILLAGSLGLYYCLCGRGILALGSSILISYGAGNLIYTSRQKKCSDYFIKISLTIGIMGTVMPLILVKKGNFILNNIFHSGNVTLWQTLGIAYYTLQAIGYMIDVYRGEILPETNLAKYALFISFFPQIVQGPIARYGQLQCQFFSGNRFDEQKFSKGLQWILWGFFLKLMIADRAGVIVNTVFDDWEIYTGCYVLAAGILYSIQLYTDFMACVFIARGIALLFTIELMDNFMRPYFSDSIKEFWSRWHISLSSWLRDYIYIPLGGNRKGKIRKWINMGIVFIVSGMWHGSGYRYIVWGLLHAVYQIVGEITANGRKRLYRFMRIEETDLLASVIKKSLTFFWVMLAWIIFRADSLKIGIKMLVSLFTVYNPWIFFDDSLFALGLDIKECMLLFLTVLLLFAVSCKQNKMKIEIGEWLLEQHIILRWCIYLVTIAAIVVFGAYGYGFEAQDFIYGGF